MTPKTQQVLYYVDKWYLGEIPWSTLVEKIDEIIVGEEQ